MRHSVARVDDCAGERAGDHLLRRPRRGEREHRLDTSETLPRHFLGTARRGRARLNGDVEALHVVRLEHDLRGELAVLGRVHRRLGEQEVVLLT